MRAALTNASAEGVALRHGVAGGGLQRRSDQRVVVYIGDFGDYAISAPETISLVIPAIALRSGAPILAGSDRFSGPFVVSPSRGTATLTGNLLLDPYESVIQSVEGASLRIDLAGDTWLPEVGSEGTASIDDACTGMLISELHAEGGDASVWQTVVQAALRTRLSQVIVRESESVLRIELPQLLVYKLYAVETITASVPGACLTSGKQMRPEQIGGIPFSVLPVAGRAYVSGSLLQEALETTVQSKGASLTVTLRDDEFVGDEADFVQKCISGSLKDEPGGWGAVVMEELRANPTQYIEIREVDAGYDIEVDIPASAGYSISEPETISVVIPAELLTSGQQIPASPSFVIEVSGATDVLAGASLAGGLSEADVIADRGPWYTTHNLTITLVNDTWLAAAPALVASRAPSARRARVERDHPLVALRPPRVGHRAHARSRAARRRATATHQRARDGGGRGARRRVLVGAGRADRAVVHHPRAVGPRLDAPARTRAHAPQRVERARARRPGVAHALTHPLRQRVDARRRPRARRDARGAPLARLRAGGGRRLERDRPRRPRAAPRRADRRRDAAPHRPPVRALLDLGARDDWRLAAARRRLVRLQPLVVGAPRRHALLGRAFVSGGSLRDPQGDARAGPCSSRSRCRRVGEFSAERAATTALLGNLVADQNGTHGWNMVVAPRLARDGSLRRLSAARLRSRSPPRRASSFHPGRSFVVPPRRSSRARRRAWRSTRSSSAPQLPGGARRARPRDRGRRARRRRRGRRRLRRRDRRHAAGARRDLENDAWPSRC